MLSLRLAREYTYQLDHAGEHERLTRALSMVPILRVLFKGETREEVLSAWSRMIADGADLEANCRRELDDYLHYTRAPEDRLDGMQSVAALFDALGSWTASVEIYRRMLVEAEQADERAHIAAAELGLGRMLSQRGEYDEAFARLEHARELFEGLGD